MMRILGAQALADVVLGDDASNLEERFGRWCSQLLSIFTGKAQEAVLVADGEVSKRQQKKALRAQEMNQKKQLGGKEGKASAVEAAAARKAAKNTAAKATVEKAAAPSGCCGGGAKSAPASNDAGSCGCNTGASSTEVNSNTLGLDPGCCSDEEEEEDIINNTYVTMDHAEAAEDAAEELHRKEMEGLLDLEDMGSAMNKTSAEAAQHRQAVKDALREDGAGAVVERREMVTKLQRKALTKEGYKIIGTHSAVKICRWTKNQLRGRGGCYKHSFYGITSYQCMEATPSLACANKCVFCWRHHKNPVGTEWRWKEDSPELIVSEAVRLHQGMINEMRGVPGVQAERLQEAFTVRHCALSLVGEPIMYPRINEMLAQLHERDISSFLVTNAQFPEHIRSLDPVTQLYVSVDASTRDSLKAIDRPLFKDFWERFLGSLEELKKKQQRTVYRMTLVKSWNMDQAEGYAELIEQGQPGTFTPCFC
jgi:tRNA wybutosine-synthesizing protein 1